MAASTQNGAHAYRTGGDLPRLQDSTQVRWLSGEVELTPSADVPPEVTPAALHVAVGFAHMLWQQARCSVPAVTLGASADHRASAGDGVNSIVFVDHAELPGDLASDTPAVSDVQYRRGESGWEIVEADLYINRSRDFGPGGDLDLSTVVAHEVGHILGLLHPCEPGGEGGAPDCDDEDHTGSLMFPLYHMQLSRTSADDRMGLCFLYGTACEGGTCTADGGADFGPAPQLAPMECADASTDAGMPETECAENKPFGDICMASAQCADGVCVSGVSRDHICTRPCGGDAGACPAGWLCREVDEVDVCLPRPTSGCAVTYGSQASETKASIAYLLGLALLALRRGRSNITR